MSRVMIVKPAFVLEKDGVKTIYIDDDIIEQVNSFDFDEENEGKILYSGKLVFMPNDSGYRVIPESDIGKDEVVISPENYHQMKRVSAALIQYLGVMDDYRHTVCKTMLRLKDGEITEDEARMEIFGKIPCNIKTTELTMEVCRLFFPEIRAEKPDRGSIFDYNNAMREFLGWEAKECNPEMQEFIDSGGYDKDEEVDNEN